MLKNKICTIILTKKAKRSTVKENIVDPAILIRGVKIVFSPFIEATKRIKSKKNSPIITISQIKFQTLKKQTTNVN